VPEGKRNPDASASSETAEQYASRIALGLKKKANAKERESEWSFRLIILGTLAAPAFVTLGSNLWTGKVVPVVLSLMAGAATAWIQLRKPQQLWALYRTMQRKCELQIDRHKFRLGEYDGDDADARLAESVSSIAWETHERWLPLVPNAANLQGNETKHGPRVEMQ
jgi:hypothetical protein